ncbi:MAG: hypothetical protein A2287_06560 [Candidatus Melainabacteria bacterium RIFOXYA12_FULL_32_12]|nr:MAG: hypothetical protein A2104_03450 [Candidatus Melainabacteria bacterium GWF2_32_7]OGI22942.1 MAG: hypothetical protein A2255_06005 [Candidatus Melainabacteria bacterium RIFOXYA2_FULL_32_9]OGI26874.1 MAG: hypothetical protein A2287_06560 [Candidatus Melainabacteria bacterium RIFOXYA12_FULL_32_12]
MTNINEIKQKELILLILTLEGGLFLIALLWGYLAKINPFNKIYFDYADIFWAIIGAVFILLINYVSINELSKLIPFFRNLKDAYNDIAYLAANVSLPGALVIALISGFAEEFFFRGILQQQFGIVIASVVFGLFHIGNAKTLYYGIYAVIIGFYLGWLFIFTGNLLVPIIVHVLNNFIALPYMRYYYHKYIEENQNV